MIHSRCSNAFAASVVWQAGAVKHVIRISGCSTPCGISGLAGLPRCCQESTGYRAQRLAASVGLAGAPVGAPSRVGLTGAQRLAASVVWQEDIKMTNYIWQ